MAGKIPILVILGPTASGKSALAELLAARVGGEILSVDSMQVYRGMNIGTAKPSAEVQSAIRYHLLDLVDPNESFTVARFVELADRVIAESIHPLIATGGTPLYYKSLFEGLFEGPTADPAIRQRLSQLSPEVLHQQLAAIDPTAAGRIHMNDTRRVIRALEVYEVTGQPISSFQTEWETPKPRHAAVYFGLLWEKDAINRRINARVKSMIASGWVEETRRLLEQYGQLSMTAGEATGYRELIAFVQGRMKLDDAIEQIKISTRQLARKQMKWFKRFPNVRWINGDQPTDALASDILMVWPTSINDLG